MMELLDPLNFTAITALNTCRIRWEVLGSFCSGAVYEN